MGLCLLEKPWNSKTNYQKLLSTIKRIFCLAPKSQRQLFVSGNILLSKLFLTKIFYRRSVHSIQGYSSKGREILEDKNLYEFKESLDVQSVALSCILPDEALPKLRNSLKDLSSQIKDLCKFLM